MEQRLVTGRVARRGYDAQDMTTDGNLVSVFRKMQVSPFRLEAVDTRTVAPDAAIRMCAVGRNAFGHHARFHTVPKTRDLRDVHQIEVDLVHIKRRFERNQAVDKTRMVHMQMRQEERGSHGVDAYLLERALEHRRAFVGRRARIHHEHLAFVFHHINVRLGRRDIREGNLHHIDVRGAVNLLPSIAGRIAQSCSHSTIANLACLGPAHDDPLSFDCFLRILRAVARQRDRTKRIDAKKLDADLV